MKSVVVDRRGYDWEGDRPLRHPFAKTIIYEMHVAGFTRHPSSGVRGGQARDLRRADREDPVPRRPRGHRGRAAAGLPVRRAGRARGADELLGLRARLLLRAARRATARARTPSARSTSSATWSRPCTAPASRSSSTWSTTTRRRRTKRARRSASAAWRTASTTCSSRTRRATPTTPAPATPLNANHSVVRRMILDSLRYWVEEMHVDGFRFDLASILSRDDTGKPLKQPPGDLGHRVRPGPRRDQADRRGLGRRGALPGGQLRRRHLDRVERAVPRRRARFRQGRSRHGPAGRRAAAGQPGHLRSPGARAGAEHQLRDLPRRVHAERPGLVRPQAQRGQRRGQPRRRGRQPELELRRGGADRRPGRSSGCATAR